MFQYIVLDSGVIIKGDGNNLYKLSDNVVVGELESIEMMIAEPFFS